MQKKKIYCTNCGREIRDGLHYCDRCGQSVKKSLEQQSPKEKRKKQIEQIENNRMSRREKMRERDIKRRKNREKSRKQLRVLLIIVIFLIIGLISAISAFIIMSGSSQIKHVDDTVREDLAASATETPKEIETMASGTQTDFKTIEANGISCPYPAGFLPGTSSGNTVLEVSDAKGGAVMAIVKDKPSGTDTAELMMAAASKLGGSLTYSRAGEDWYEITVRNDGMITHRRYVINGGSALYYDFTYDEKSSCAREYEAYITNMDENFKLQ